MRIIAIIIINISIEDNDVPVLRYSSPLSAHVVAGFLVGRGDLQPRHLQKDSPVVENVSDRSCNLPHEDPVLMMRETEVLNSLHHPRLCGGRLRGPLKGEPGGEPGGEDRVQADE